MTQINPTNLERYGWLQLSGLTQVTGASAVLGWYTPGDPWAGGNNYAQYYGWVTLGISGVEPLNFGPGDFGSAYSWVVATAAPVPIPAAVWLLGSGLIGLIGIRRRFKE